MTLDPEQLRLPPDKVTDLLAGSKVSTRPPRHRTREEFLKGPIPLDWLGLADRLPGRTLAVALALWFEIGRKNRRRVSLTRAIFVRLDVKPKAQYHGLRALEGAGLVRVDRRTGKNPTVTILDAPTVGRTGVEADPPADLPMRLVVQTSMDQIRGRSAQR
jgi:hypothetical protein